MRNSGVTRPVLGATIAGWLMGGLGGPAMAEDAIPPAVQRRLEELELKVRTLERQQEVSEEVHTAEKAKQTATVSAGADGFALKSTDGAFQLKLRGLLHADSRWFFESFVPGTDDTYLIRRARPYIEGTVFNIFDFKFMPDFARRQDGHPGRLCRRALPALVADQGRKVQDAVRHRAPAIGLRHPFRRAGVAQ